MRALVRVMALAVLTFALAGTIHAPASGQSAVAGSAIVAEGTVVMSIEDDFKSGRATRRYFLATHAKPGERYALDLTAEQAKSIQPGMRVRVIGRLVGHVLTAEEARAV